MLLSLVGLCFPQLRVGVGEVQLRFEDGQAVQLAGVITIGDSGDRVEPYSLQGLAGLAPLLNKPLTEVAVAEDGELRMAFGQTIVACPRDEEYEPWNYSGFTSKVVAMAEGEFGIWTDMKRG